MKLYFIHIEDTLEPIEYETVVDYSRELQSTEIAFLFSRLLYTKRIQRITENDNEFNDLLNCINDINVLFASYNGNDMLKIVVVDYLEEDFNIINGVIEEEITEEEIKAIEEGIKKAL